MMEVNYRACALVTLLMENIALYGCQIASLELFICFISRFTQNEYFKNASVFLVFSYLNYVLLRENYKIGLKFFIDLKTEQNYP